MGDPTPVPYKAAAQQLVPMREEPEAGRMTPCDTEEMMLIRYLLMFGMHGLYEEERNGQVCVVTVGEYIINELAEDELMMMNQNFRRFSRNIASIIETGNLFLLNISPGILILKFCSVVADILSEPYELSKLWTAKDADVRTEETLLSELLPRIVDNYKMRRIEMMCRQADEKILECQNAGDSGQLIEWLKKKDTMVKVRARLNQKLKRTI